MAGTPEKTPFILQGRQRFTNDNPHQTHPTDKKLQPGFFMLCRKLFENFFEKVCHFRLPVRSSNSTGKKHRLFPQAWRGGSMKPDPK